MAPKKITNKETEIHIVSVERGEATFCIVSTEPLMHNCLSYKSKMSLLMPSAKKTATEKKTTLKHNPYEEYNESVYYSANPKGATFVQHPSSAFRKAMGSAALELPGVTKAEIARLLYVQGDRVDIFGVPLLDMRIVRQAGINRAPDVRTRCMMQEWACRITVSYVMPQLRMESAANLLAAAGMYIGVGDYRNEKGAGNFGLFRIASEDDPDFKRIVKAGGRKAQIENMENPEFSNTESERLYRWQEEEVKKHRSFEPLKSKRAHAKA